MKEWQNHILLIGKQKMMKKTEILALKTLENYI